MPSRKAKPIILGTSRRAGLSGFYYVIVPDCAAGKRNRYTLYRIPNSPSKKIRILGRELPYRLCVKIAKGKRR